MGSLRPCGKSLLLSTDAWVKVGPARRCLGLLLVNLGYTGLRSNRENFAVRNLGISAEGMKQGWPGYTDKLVPWRQQ